MTDTYRVTAPYVVLKSTTEQGALIALGYYKDALLPETVDAEDLARHIRKGMVEKVEGAELKSVQKQQAEADKAEAAEEKADDKEGAALIKKAEADRAAADKAAADEEAAAAKAGTPLIKASDSKSGAKTAQAG
jgi:hypothetical protein